MIVTLIKKSALHSATLPQRVSGQFWLADVDACGNARRLTNIEGVDGAWMIRSSDSIAILDERGMELPGVMLSPQNSYVLDIRYRAPAEKAQLFVEPITAGRQTYTKYSVSGNCDLEIGRAETNQIRFNNKYVSSQHAVLSHRAGAWEVADTQSTNGIFVNEVRCVSAKLKAGDAVYIMGLRIIIGPAFLAVNNPDSLVSVQGGSLHPFALPSVNQPSPYAGPTPLFFRAPRFQRSITAQEIRVDAPPPPERMEEIPPALLIGPALTMGMTALLMGGVSINNLLTEAATVAATAPTLAMSVSMLAGTLLWPTLTRRNERRRKKTAEETRTSAYRRYLDSVREQLFQLQLTQQEILLENHPPLHDLIAYAQERHPRLWERTIGKEDFLQVRIGTGDLPLQADIKYPEQRFSVDEDHLNAELCRLMDAPKQLQAVPISYSLLRDYVSGIVNDRDLSFTRALLLQIATLHSYDEVKLVFLLPAEDMRFDFVKWLPHVWDDRRSMRFLAANDDELKALSSHLERVIAQRQGSAAQQAAAAPHYVIFAMNHELAGRAEAIRRILDAPESIGFSIIYLADELRDLPKECLKAIHLSGKSASIYDKQELTGSKTMFTPDTAQDVDARDTSIVLANIELETQSSRYTLPTLMTFLEMYGVAKTEHLNALTRWSESNPVYTLQAPIGVDTEGEPFYLDLHEKFHGPHGLVAGMTGSGKSEFIITYILSMAVHYHPDEVAFILIDYKGGGLAGAFENTEQGIRLPHLAGTITNLDGAAVKRSLISIQSELRRRQAIFNAARRSSNEGTIDIYKYQKMYRSGTVSEAVPHLFIISDEFAELKSQQPEFMEQLISAARIGRSLGIHLVLATQKPSGVVDDQIWSNSRFRICLKVQEKADSMDMIKRPDAAELAETGRFYLQVGFNELFALGQSAWCGAPYLPADRFEKSETDSVAVVDRVGRVMEEVKLKAKGMRAEPEGSQVVSIVKYLSALAQEEGISTRQLWLPAIPAFIRLDDLREKYGYTAQPFAPAPVIGEYDDPFNQQQGLLTLPLCTQGNAIVYGTTGSGKTTLLNTLLCSLLRDYDAAQLHVYIIDLGAETLRVFAKAPQVGDVLLDGDGEKIGNLLKMLSAEVARRKKLFAEYAGGLAEYCKATETTLPNVLVVIRNYAAFTEQFEQYEDALLQLTREGNKYGLYFVLTANAPNAVRSRMLQNFKQLVVLQMNDRSDYMGILGSTEGVYPSSIKGRGIIRTDRVYEFQTAHSDREETPETLRRFCEGLAGRTAARAARIPTLPEHVDCTLFSGPACSLSAFPIGVEKSSLALHTIDLKSRVVSLLAAQDLFALARTAQGCAETLAVIPDTRVVVLDSAALFSADGTADYTYHASELETQVRMIFDEMVRRNNGFKAHGDTATFAPTVCVITSLSQLMGLLTADGQDKLRVLLERGEAYYNIHFLLCDTAKGFTEASLQPWYKRHVTGEGIWVGDGIAEQYILKINRVGGDLYMEVPDGFGYAVYRGRAVLTKLLAAAARETEGTADE